MNFGLSTAESCNFVLAASFAKDCEYFDHCCLRYPDLLEELVAVRSGRSWSLLSNAAPLLALQRTA